MAVGIILKPSIYANIPKTRAFDEKPSNIIDKTLLGYCKAFFCYYLLATDASNDWATGFFWLTWTSEISLYFSSHKQTRAIQALN